MEQIPADRGFLDLTRLEPGVQLLDGQVLAPSKSGLTATSIVGRNGRTTRMQVDGMDVTDETVGATTTNLPVGAIQEVGVDQSLLPLSSGLASAGAVNVITKSGANDIHGQLFGNFRNKAAGGASLPGEVRTIPTLAKFLAECWRGLEERQALLFSFGRIFQAGPRGSRRLQRSLRCSSREVITLHFTRLKCRAAWITRLLRQSQLFYRFTYDNGSDGQCLRRQQLSAAQEPRQHVRAMPVGFDFTRGSYASQPSFCLQPLLQ